MKRFVPYLLILALLLALLGGCSAVNTQDVLELAGDVLEEGLQDAAGGVERTLDGVSGRH